MPYYLEVHKVQIMEDGSRGNHLFIRSTCPRCGKEFMVPITFEFRKKKEYKCACGFTLEHTTENKTISILKEKRN